MESDIGTLLEVFMLPHHDTHIAIDEFVSRVEETTSKQLTDSVRDFFHQKNKLDIATSTTNIAFCDGMFLNVTWRKRPLRFELVHAKNVDAACKDAIAFDELTPLREKRLQLQTQLSQILVYMAKKENKGL